jgi:hypothetical protein
MGTIANHSILLHSLAHSVIATIEQWPSGPRKPEAMETSLSCFCDASSQPHRHSTALMSKLDASQTF